MKKSELIASANTSEICRVYHIEIDLARGQRDRDEWQQQLQDIWESVRGTEGTLCDEDQQADNLGVLITGETATEAEKRLRVVEHVEFNAFGDAIRPDGALRDFLKILLGADGNVTIKTHADAADTYYDLADVKNTINKMSDENIAEYFETAGR